MYEKRLLKFVAANNGQFTADDVAAIWKRSSVDVWQAAIRLTLDKKIKVKGRTLFMKEGAGLA